MPTRKMAVHEERVDVSPEAVFETGDLKKYYHASGGSIIQRFFGEGRYLKAVDGVSFSINQGEILGLAGQSGCGKSTLGSLLVGLENPTEGSILYNGEDITQFGKNELKEFRRNCQIIFQDPYEAVNPRFPVFRTVNEPLKIHGLGDRETREARVIEALEDAGLTPAEEYLEKRPGELSGGERQRVCIARALVLDPDFIMADEPVSMLDVSVSTGILKLFKRLQRERDLTMLYISHDLSTINYLADRTMIMYLGNIVEVGPTEHVIHDPAHPYTEDLLGSIPNSGDKSDPKTTETTVPDPINLPSGCRYHPNCAHATDECRATEPLLEQHGNQKAACYHPVNE